MGILVRDHLPLKQGLRLIILRVINSFTVRDHLPLKQGLRRGMVTFSEEDSASVRDHLPLKQGLRQHPK